MSNLTEKWKQGKLVEGIYYYIKVNGKEIPARLSKYGNFYLTEGACGRNAMRKVEQILAPVPSYAKYMCLVDYKEEVTKACKMRDEIIKKYEDIDSWWQAENQRLKELLKECVEVLNDAQRNYGYDDSILDICSPIITKIDEVLK